MPASRDCLQQQSNQYVSMFLNKQSNQLKSTWNCSLVLSETHMVLHFAVSMVDRLTQVAEESLAKVKLSQVTNARAGSYSGGMKRRLSVAIALIGDPKLVFLDEPVRKIEFFLLVCFLDTPVALPHVNLIMYMLHRLLAWIQ